MTMADIGGSKGFPAGVRFTPVPNPLLADLLEEIEDVGELKLTLRVVWALNRQRGFPKFVTASDMSSDQTVARMLGATGQELERVVNAKLEASAKRGTFLRAGGAQDHAGARFYLNTEENRRELTRSGDLSGPSVVEQPPETWQGSEAMASGGAFTEYEENIGPLTPVVIGRMADVLIDHSEEDVIGAIRAAVTANARNWNYISAVLRARGTTTSPRTQGSGQAAPGQRGKDGKPGRNSPQGLTDEFIRKYVERQRARGQPGSGN
ncbi:MAG: DnaD domain protein [Dehalococcoidia bacterium]|nr:DnaD domain protein [Dehalococcoidia bacterium]MSQ35420.1 DnaD domain protein [Dehalococcoidia bacterium]